MAKAPKSINCRVCGRRVGTNDRALINHKKKYHDHRTIFDTLGDDWRYTD